MPLTCPLVVARAETGLSVPQPELSVKVAAWTSTPYPQEICGQASWGRLCWKRHDDWHNRWSGCVAQQVVPPVPSDTMTGTGHLIFAKSCCSKASSEVMFAVGMPVTGQRLLRNLPGAAVV